MSADVRLILGQRRYTQIRWFGLWPEWLFQYFNELPLGEGIESFYILLKSEQQILTPKYDILHSLVPLVNHYFVTMYDDDHQLKISCKRCNGVVTC